MGTQAVVSVRQDCKVKYKIICGMNGNRAPEFAKALKNALQEEESLDLDEIYDLASHYIGTGNDLVVMSENSEFHHCSERLTPRYRDTFHKATFNPRWEHGTADHMIVIDLDR